MGTTFSTGEIVGKRTSQLAPQVRFKSPPGPDANRVPHGSAPFLPFDAPPMTNNRPPSVVRGLSASVNLGAFSPVPRPFTQFQSDNFPLSLMSNAGPAAIGAHISKQNNTYSPASHWRARQLQEANTTKPATPNPFYGRAKGLRRIKGRVVPFPFASPSWTSVTGRTVQ